jgi:hypothetical protein
MTLCIPFGIVSGDSPDEWISIADGLDMARFPTSEKASSGDSTIVIIRIDPSLWTIRLLAGSETGDADGMSAKKWCESYGLTAAINAGMFDLDHTTHIGYMKSRTHTNSTHLNSYLSAAAFDPKHDTLPAFRIYDLDETPLDSVLAWYHSVAQNLRLIKRPAENRWSQQDRRWSEAALGEDDKGRMMFIFCRPAYSMYDLNHILMSLPIGLVCAQHLEGGPEAQIYLKHDEVELELVGDHETGFIKSNSKAWPIPNIIGIVPRSGM